MKPQYIVIHHSLTKDGLIPDWEAIRRYHIEEKGWKDIGYHYGIEDVWGEVKLREGRPITEEGAHCLEAGMNQKSIGICVIGNFDDIPAPINKLYFLRDLCFSLMVNYGIPAQNVIGHRDAGMMEGYDWRRKGPTGIPEYKSCPGTLFPLMALKDILAGKVADLVTPE